MSALESGKFDALMNGNRAVVIPKGKLLVFPCAPGDSVFMLIDGTPHKFTVKRFSVFDGDLNWIMYIQSVSPIRDEHGNDRSYYEATEGEIGNAVFMTMEDAIAEMRKGREE